MSLRSSNCSKNCAEECRKSKNVGQPFSYFGSMGPCEANTAVLPLMCSIVLYSRRKGLLEGDQMFGQRWREYSMASLEDSARVELPVRM